MDEMTPEQLFNKWTEQQHELQKRAQQGLPTGPQSNAPTIEEQTVLTQVQASAAPTPVTPTHDQCPQCSLFHPAVGPGEKCPNAPVKIEGVSEVSINEFVVKVKDILSSQLEQKGVKEYKKFIGGMVVALMKYCEEYKE